MARSPPDEFAWLPVAGLMNETGCTAYVCVCVCCVCMYVYVCLCAMFMSVGCECFILIVFVGVVKVLVECSYLQTCLTVFV